jgi:hypothetical protein
VHALLRGDAERARFEATLEQARRLGSRLFSTPSGSHSDRVSRSVSPLLRLLVTLQQRYGAEAAESGLFGPRTEWMLADQFKCRVLALACRPVDGRILREARALRRHLQ